MGTFRAFLATTLFSYASLIAQAQELNGLNHTKWKLIELNNGEPVAPAGIPFTLTLERNSYLLAGCNSVSGKLRIDGNKLIFSPGPSTLKACMPETEAADAAFLRLTGSSATFQAAQDRLTLTAEGGERWVFRKEPLPSLNATTRFIYVAPTTKDCADAGRSKCLQVRDSKDQPWTLLHSDIIGFDFVPGIEYRLRIKEDKVQQTAAGSPNVIWYLDLMVEQSVVDRKAADDYMKSKKP
jgi:heat shock protein HslJ